MNFISGTVKEKHTLRTLFLTTLYISVFTFGGGFVIVSFMKKHFVDRLKWIDNDEMLDLVALAQSSPGAIAVNAAILVGWRVRGILGMLTAVLGTIIPPMVIISVISLFYAAFAANRYVALMLQGMRAGVAAIILDVTCELGGNVIRTKSWLRMLLMAAAFTAAFVFGVNAVYIILAALVIGLCFSLPRARKGVADDISSAFMELYSNRAVQRGRRLCGHRADTVAGGGAVCMAHYGGIYRPGDHCRDDSGARRHKLRHFRGNTGGGSRGRCGGYAGLHSPA